MSAGEGSRSKAVLPGIGLAPGSYIHNVSVGRARQVLLAAFGEELTGHAASAVADRADSGIVRDGCARDPVDVLSDGHWSEHAFSAKLLDELRRVD